MAIFKPFLKLTLNSYLTYNKFQMSQRINVDKTTVNLRAPLVVNALNRKSKQIMLDQPEYTFRHILGDLNQKEGK